MRFCPLTPKSFERMKITWQRCKDGFHLWVYVLDEHDDRIDEAGSCMVCGIREDEFESAMEI